MKNDFSKIISEFISGRAKPKLEKFDKDAEKRRKNTESPEDLAELESTLSQERRELEEKFDPAIWLTNASHRAWQQQLVTHAPKFSHPDAKGSSFYTTGESQQPESMQHGATISTASLCNPDIDSVGNAAALDVTAFLQLSHNGKTLIDHIQEDDPTPLQPFAADNKQLEEWMAGFREVLTGKELSSHKLSKQIYFPIEEGQYHLLSPLHSSSITHAVFKRIAFSRFSDEAKITRKAKRESKYHDEGVTEYPNTAIQSFGGTKPQNISQLNSNRGGRAFLLSCAPPTWKTQAGPPLGSKTVFSQKHFGYRVRRETRELRHFLERQVDRAGTMAIRNKREEMIDKIIDHLIQYGAEIQSLKDHAGWSISPECGLHRAEQLWLDPHRAGKDEAFEQERQKNDWQTAVADQFAFWLNKKIRSKRLTPGDAEHRQWQSLVALKLRLLKKDLEVFA